MEANLKLLEQIEDEIREDYLLSVKKAIVDFVLKDPTEQYTYSPRDAPCVNMCATLADPNDRPPMHTRTENDEALPAHRRELQVVPKPWHGSFLYAFKMAQRHLHVTNRCMTQVLDLWFSQFK